MPTIVHCHARFARRSPRTPVLRGGFAACALGALMLLAACGEGQVGPDRGDIDADVRTANPGNNAGQPVRTIPTTVGTHSLEAFGTFVAGPEDRPLYILEQDPRGESICYEGCERAWPPLMAAEGAPMPAAGSPIQPGDLTTVRRIDGGLQVAFRGKPLYYYAADLGDDRALGHGVRDNWGSWYLIGPDGERLPTPEELPARAGLQAEGESAP